MVHWPACCCAGVFPCSSPSSRRTTEASSSSKRWDGRVAQGWGNMNKVWANLGLFPLQFVITLHSENLEVGIAWDQVYPPPLLCLPKHTGGSMITCNAL